MSETPVDPRQIAPLPEEPIDRLAAPVRRFLHVEAAGGAVLLGAAAVALVLANSAWSDAFLSIWKTPVQVGFGDFVMKHSLRHWINDGLMAVFFFVIGLEVKRELVLGELQDARRAALPIAGALGGMLVPAGLYLALQGGEPGASGWGIPMATDIAFVVGAMAVLGRRIPPGLRVMLLSLAIADDIGAILVIAIGYTDTIHLTALGLGVVGIAMVVALQRLGVRSIGVYLVVGVFIWVDFHESGIHATIAGVILGLQTPAGAWVSENVLGETVKRLGLYAHGDPQLWDQLGRGRQRKVLFQMETAAREAMSPLERLENHLHPWSSFGIMPLFALANAGVVLEPSYLASPVAVAIVVGLALGKPLGIFGFCWMAVKLGVASLPAGVGWRTVLGGGCLAGIGFTMALFIAGLALEGSLLDAAKVGILGASVLAAVVGMGVLLTQKAPAEAR